MAIKSGEKTIKNMLVCVTGLPARPKLQAMYLAGKVIPAIVRNVSGIADTVSSVADENIDLKEMMEKEVSESLQLLKKFDMNSIANSIQDIFNVVSFEDFIKFAETTLQATLINGKNAAAMLSDGYAGEDLLTEDMVFMFDVIKYTLEINSFFGLEGIGTLLFKKKSKSQSKELPDTSQTE